DFFDFRRTIGDAFGFEAGVHRFAPYSTPFADVLLVRRPHALVVRVVDLFLVHVEPDEGTLARDVCCVGCCPSAEPATIVAPTVQAALSTVRLVSSLAMNSLILLMGTSLPSRKCLPIK